MEKNTNETAVIAINGRSIYQLAALTPGASSQINSYVNTPVGGDANVQFNGLRQNHNIYLLDGGENEQEESNRSREALVPIRVHPGARASAPKLHHRIILPKTPM